MESDMWLQDISNYQVFGIPLWVILLCGVAGILVDLDHPIAYYWLKGLNGRFLHTPLLIASCIVFLGCCAYIGGLLITLVLGR